MHRIFRIAQGASPACVLLLSAAHQHAGNELWKPVDVFMSHCEASSTGNVRSTSSLSPSFQSPCGSHNIGVERPRTQLHTLATSNMQREMETKDKRNNMILSDTMSLIAGSSHPELAKKISRELGVHISQTSMSRHSDGEVSIQFNENVRGQDVFIIQSCTAPVNDSIMELLLSVSCARRAGAKRVICVIPYFGYKHHRRASQISTKHQSRFLSSNAMDFAKMLQEMGVDRVISVDLQRPGQGQEACFFDTDVPLEVLLSLDSMVQYFVKSKDIALNAKNTIVVTPNAECFKKARKFQLGLLDALKSKSENVNEDISVKLGAFLTQAVDSRPLDYNNIELVGHSLNVNGSDVIIVDDMIDTAGTLTAIAKKLETMGAVNVYVTASHGLFTESSMSLIDTTKVLRKVIVTNSLPQPSGISDSANKVVQVNVGKSLAKVILAEHLRSLGYEGYIFTDNEGEDKSESEDELLTDE